MAASNKAVVIQTLFRWASKTGTNQKYSEIIHLTGTCTRSLWSDVDKLWTTSRKQLKNKD
jgi:hypothetical protein